jgi:hypothetical protein
MEREMLKRIVIAAVAACALASTAYAVEEQAADPACVEQLTKAEEMVHDKVDANALSEQDTNKVNELLDQADMQCSEGAVEEANATLATVHSMLGH